MKGCVVDFGGVRGQWLSNLRLTDVLEEDEDDLKAILQMQGNAPYEPPMNLQKIKTVGFLTERNWKEHQSARDLVNNFG